eukprot:CAMPEP_0168237606 /NCGR_PEP_ID=MMETSP0140_2-20121125/20330_1 /TAXON_ID=44445 /ORGANISM="Pseudo-nitzschia australis, Strain 10249 10 AB" /LENGTH=83 /DNA_ID=CAMNT_0008171359 /DNA_START=376 /DNA_END=624 /DNA_ORIENTATION=-
MIPSQSVVMDILASLFRVVAFPLLEHGHDPQDHDTLMRSTSSSPSSLSSLGLHHLNPNFRDLRQLWLMLEEPTTDDLTGNGMW